MERRTVSKAKPFAISEQEVYEAYRRVRANKGACGVDGQTWKEFDANLQKNLYRIWNRMSSGSYFPQAVKRVEIPKSDGKIRPLGIPTLTDRIAQMVVKRRIEPDLEAVFHPNSYGYRPKRNAHQAIASAKERCWRYDWVLDIDIKGFFDNIEHGLMMRAVGYHVKEKWMLLYIERWLKASVLLKDGQMQKSEKGTPQGGVISPLLANLFLHYAFDTWMKEQYAHIPFERYADDIICHCHTQEEAQALKLALEMRMRKCRLELHPEKTKIVCCKVKGNKDTGAATQFDFLGYGFKPRRSITKTGRVFTNFSPGVSDKAGKTMRETIRSWNLGRRSDLSLIDIANFVRPRLQGWTQYYGRFYRSALISALRNLDAIIVHWAQRKYKALRGRAQRAWNWLAKLKREAIFLFPHWQCKTTVSTTGAV